MIVTDVNLLVHAYNSESPVHDPARRWWEDLLNGSGQVGLTWVAILGFVRITTHRSILANPMHVDAACSHVRSWLAQPVVSLVHPGSRHSEILFGLLQGLGTAGNLTTDAHLAAVAIEHQAELHSTDADFARFPGLRWSNPLRTSSAKRFLPLPLLADRSASQGWRDASHARSRATRYLLC